MRRSRGSRTVTRPSRDRRSTVAAIRGAAAFNWGAPLSFAAASTRRPEWSAVKAWIA